MNELTQWLLDAIRAHGAFSVFIGVLIESVIIPIPSPLVIMGAGAILVPPELSLGAALGRIASHIVLPGSVGSTIGAFIGYGLGFWGGKPVIDRLQRFLGFGWHDVEGMGKRLTRRHAGIILLLLRAVPVVPLSLISIAAGLIRWPIASFTGWTWLGSIPRCLLLGYLGWATGETYHGLAHRMDRVESLVSGAIVVTSLVLILWLRQRFRKQS